MVSGPGRTNGRGACVCREWRRQVRSVLSNVFVLRKCMCLNKPIGWTVQTVSNANGLYKLIKNYSYVGIPLVRQRNWIGHILRGNSLLGTALEGKMEGKRTRGKPRIKMLDRIMTEQKDTPSSATMNWDLRHKTDWNGVITTRTCQLRQRTKKKKAYRITHSFINDGLVY